MKENISNLEKVEPKKKSAEQISFVEFKPFWNDYSVEMGAYLPWCAEATPIDKIDGYIFNHWHLKSVQNSWFTAEKLSLNIDSGAENRLPPMPNNSMSPNLTQLKSLKIKIVPNEKQVKILDKWFNTAQIAYNKTIAYLKQPGTKANWKDIKTNIIKSLPIETSDTPYQIKSIAIRDACQAISKAKKKYIKCGKIQNVKFKSGKRKKSRDNIFIPKKVVTSKGFYRRMLKDMVMTEALPSTKANHDCRLLRHNGNWYLIVPVPLNIAVISNKKKIVALDPGVRTFQTFYSTAGQGKLGYFDIDRIYRLCHNLDKLQSKISKARHRKKMRLIKAVRKIRSKIRNLIDEAHHKIARWLCLNFEIILMPTFKISKMVKKLNSKVARTMLTWAHFRFKQYLKFKAQEFGVRVIEVCEAYTSKTCGVCGALNNIGGKPILKCSNCNSLLDRDLNGARNILLRYLTENQVPLLDKTCVA